MLLRENALKCYPSSIGTFVVSLALLPCLFACHVAQADLILHHEAALACYDDSDSNCAAVTSIPSNSTYTFDGGDDLGATYTDLKARVSLSFSYDPEIGTSNDAWVSTHAKLTAHATLDDFLDVQGATGVPGGWIQFFWSVDGQQSLSFDMPYNGSASSAPQVNVSIFEASATLEATANGDPLPFDGSEPYVSLLSQPGTPENLLGRETPYLANPPLFQSDFSTFVPWVGGEQVHANFLLTSSVELEMSSPGEVAAFTAVLASDFSNTARLTGVAIFDSSCDTMNVSACTALAGATVVGTNNGTYAAVPEPSAAAYLSVMAAMLAPAWWRRARAGHSFPVIR